MTASKKMDEVFELSIKEIRGVLNGTHNATDASRMAVSTMGVYSRLRATEIHESVLKYQMAKDMSDDKKQLKAAVKELTA